MIGLILITSTYGRKEKSNFIFYFYAYLGLIVTTIVLMNLGVSSTEAVNIVNRATQDVAGNITDNVTKDVLTDTLTKTNIGDIVSGLDVSNPGTVVETLGTISSGFVENAPGEMLDSVSKKSLEPFFDLTAKLLGTSVSKVAETASTAPLPQNVMDIITNIGQSFNDHYLNSLTGLNTPLSERIIDPLTTAVGTTLRVSTGGGKYIMNEMNNILEELKKSNFIKEFINRLNINK